MHKHLDIKILLCGVALAILLLGAWHLARWHRQTVIVAYRAHMRDPAYRAAQTVKLQPSLEGEMRAQWPDATIQPQPPGPDGVTAYAVRFPSADARKLPVVYAQMLRIGGKYRKRGYQGTFLLSVNDALVKTVSIK